MFVLVRSWPYGINTECDLDALDKHEESVYEEFYSRASVSHSLADPFVIHIDSREHTKYHYYPMSIIFAAVHIMFPG